MFRSSVVLVFVKRLIFYLIESISYLMAVFEYSFQYKIKIPLLTEEEYDDLWPKIQTALDALKTGPGKLQMKNIAVQQSVPEVINVMKYVEDTYGHRFENLFDLYNIELSRFGRPCPKCGKLFRTPRAKMCAECGYELPEGEVAGAYPM